MKNCILFLICFTVTAYSTSFAKDLNSAPCAKIIPSPDSLKFPLLAQGAVDTLSFLLTNSGDLDWAPGFPSITPNNGMFVISSFDSSSLAPGKSRMVTVQFSPFSIGTFSSAITFPDGGPCQNQFAIYLSGSGGCPQIAFPDSVRTTVEGSAAFTITIVNNGTYDWFPGVPTISGTGKACFAVVTISPSTLCAGCSGIITMKATLGKGVKECCAELDFPFGSPCDNPVSINICAEAPAADVQEASTSEGFSLEQNYPNPVVDETSFTYETPKEIEVNLLLSDLSGNPLKILTKGIVSAGKHLIRFNASDLSSGIYMYTLQAGTTRLHKEMVVTK